MNIIEAWCNLCESEAEGVLGNRAMAKAYDFEQTQEDLTDLLDEVWRVSLRFDEFELVGNEAVRLKEYVGAVRPRRETPKYRLILSRIRRDWVTPIAMAITAIGALSFSKYLFELL